MFFKKGLGAAQSSRRGELIALLLAVLAALIAQGFLAISYRQPLSITGDHYFILMSAKMLGHGDFWGSSYLGYPLGHNAEFFPEFEFLLKLMLGLAASLGFGPFLTIKLFYALGIAAMVSASYWCLRKLDISRWLACCAAIAFVVSPYFLVRAVNHDTLSIYIPAPFGATLAILIVGASGTRDLVRVLTSPFGLVASIVVATCGVYYAFFSLLFVGAAFLVATIKSKQPWPLLIGAAFAAVITAVMLLSGLAPYIPMLFSGHLAPPKRMPIEQFYHGLSVSDAIYTLRDIGAFPKHVAHYQAIRSDRLVGEGAAEWPGLVLTPTILAAPLVLLFAASTPSVGAGRRARIAIAAAFIVFGMIFAARGGVGYLFNEFVSPEIRAQTRIMPFLAFFAVVTLCQASELLRADARRWARLTAVAIPALMLLAAVPSMNALLKAQRRTVSDSAVGALEASTRAMLAAKTAHGLKAVLEMPIFPWPEAPPRNGYWPYQLGLPYILDSKASPTKWSYGSAELQNGFYELRADLRGEYDPSGLAQRALGRGFDSILIVKTPFTPAELDHLDSGLGLPAACRIYNDAIQELFVIGAGACGGTPKPPPNPLNIDFTNGGGRELLAYNWSGSEPDGVWGLNNQSTLIVPKPSGSGDVDAKIAYRVYRAGPKTIDVSANGHRIGTIRVGPTDDVNGVQPFKIPAAVLKNGAMIRFEFHYLNPESPMDSGIPDNRVLGMMIKSVTLAAAP